MYKLKREQVEQFDQDGYLSIEQFLDAEETDLLLKIARTERAIVGQAQERRNAADGVSKLWITGALSEDAFSAVVHSDRVINVMEQLLGGEVYHYHHKVMLKEPLVGGAWEWHQDYGYWYSNSCLFPYMASCLIALDSATTENGCLQVIKGSQLMGRLDHGKAGEQTGADMVRVTEALKHLELVHCEMKPGSALFFHCNLLHRSDANLSPHPRWSLICCYNAARNPCQEKPNHPSYRPLAKWPHSRIKEIARRQLAQPSEVSQKAET